jgi:hypothetical protein
MWIQLSEALVNVHGERGMHAALLAVLVVIDLEHRDASAVWQIDRLAFADLRHGVA